MQAPDLDLPRTPDEGLKAENKPKVVIIETVDLSEVLLGGELSHLAKTKSEARQEKMKLVLQPESDLEKESILKEKEPSSDPQIQKRPVFDKHVDYQNSVCAFVNGVRTSKVRATQYRIATEIKYGLPNEHVQLIWNDTERFDTVAYLNATRMLSSPYEGKRAESAVISKVEKFILKSLKDNPDKNVVIVCHSAGVAATICAIDHAKYTFQKLADKEKKENPGSQHWRKRNNWFLNNIKRVVVHGYGLKTMNIPSGPQVELIFDSRDSVVKMSNAFSKPLGKIKNKFMGCCYEPPILHVVEVRGDDPHNYFSLLLEKPADKSIQNTTVEK